MNIANISSTFLQTRYDEEGSRTGINVTRSALDEALSKKSSNPNEQVVVFNNESVVLQKDTVARLKEKFDDFAEYEGVTLLGGKSADLVSSWSSFVEKDLGFAKADVDGNREITMGESLDVKSEITFDGNYNTGLTTLRKLLGPDEETIRAIEADGSLAFKTDDIIDYHLHADDNLDGKITERELKETTGVDIATMRKAEKAYRENQPAIASGGGGSPDELMEKLQKLEAKLTKLEVRASKEEDPAKLKDLDQQIVNLTQQIAVLREQLMPK